MPLPSGSGICNTNSFGNGDGEDDFVFGFPAFGDGADAAELDSRKALSQVVEKTLDIRTGWCGPFAGDMLVHQMLRPYHTHVFAQDLFNEPELVLLRGDLK